MCKKCSVVRPLEQFTKDKRCREGRSFNCHICTNAAQRARPGTRDAQRRSHLKHRYGITPEVYDALQESQSNACGICKRPFKGTPHVDHDHATGLVRGLLCPRCNGALGWYEAHGAAIAAWHIEPVGIR